MPLPNWMKCDVNEPLQTTLADITSFLQGERMPFALIGGQATSLRGEQRVTADIDIVLAADVAQALDLVNRLDDSRFKPLFADVADVVERAFILPLRHRTTNIKVDLAIGLSGFERQAVARAELIDLAGCHIPVASSEDLIIMKLLAGRPRDEQDICGLVVAQGERLDWDYCERIATELGAALGIDLAGRIRTLRGETIGDG